MKIANSTQILENINNLESIHLVERIQANLSPELSNICHLAKNMYNTANYIMRHYFFLMRESPILATEWLETICNHLVSDSNDFERIVIVTKTYMEQIQKETRKNQEKSNWDWFFQYDLRISYFQLEKILKFSPDYRAMPAQSAQQTLKKVIHDWASYREKIIKYYEKRKKMPPREFKKKYPNRPNIPKYKKKEGETIAYFTNQQCRIKEGILTFPGHTQNSKSKRWIPDVKTRFRGQFSHVEIVPKGVAYIIGIIYKKNKSNCGLNGDRVASLDLGIRNIVTMADNIGSTPRVIKGGVVKSINQFFNKERARLMSMKDKQGYKHWTMRLKRLSLNRFNKLHDAFHKLSKNIIQYCIHNNIGTIVIGYNINWKQYSNMGKRNNQNFVSIPFWKLISNIQYKAELVGIDVILIEESYTSKCSFLDGETIGKHRKYKGKRIQRGLFRASDGRIINADMNAAYNIMKKAIPKVKFADGIEGIVLHPQRANWYECTNDERVKVR
jgi:putative transposase